jgi:hypothetical protein
MILTFCFNTRMMTQKDSRDFEEILQALLQQEQGMETHPGK